MVAALGRNRAIGQNNELLWHLPDDLKRFKQLTLGHSVIMGRKTFESIIATLGRPLPGRKNIVITRDAEFKGHGTGLDKNEPDFRIAHSIEQALEIAKEGEGEEIFIIGGAQIYSLALPMASRLYLTLIDDEKTGDAFFPAYETIFTKKISEEAREHGGLSYRWITLEK